MASRLRLWCPVQLEGPCPLCLQPSNIYGDHTLSCGTGGERITRHNGLRDHLYQIAASAGLNPRHALWLRYNTKTARQHRSVDGRESSSPCRGWGSNPRPSRQKSTPAALSHTTLYYTTSVYPTTQ